LAQYCKGQVFGEEDAINDRNYTQTVRCISSCGVVLQIKKSDFIQKFGKNDATWNQIRERAQNKDQETMQRLTMGI
jgi:CRP-like cAMP-binding protein